jgi:bacteriorhodopsin
MQTSAILLLGLCLAFAAADPHNKAIVPDECESEISDHGNKALMLAFLGLFVPTCYFAYQTPRADKDGNCEPRYYHIVTTGITLIASLAYLVMATGHGYYFRPFDCRQFFYTRYVDWAFTTPLMLIDLLGFSGATADTQFFLIGVDFLMIIAGLIGSFVEGDEKYAFFGFGMLMFAPIIYYLLVDLKEAAKTKSQAVQDVYNKISMLTAITWACYPVVWLFAEGSNKLSADTEVYAYTFLDLLAKSVFGFFIINARAALAEVNNRK